MKIEVWRTKRAWRRTEGGWVTVGAGYPLLVPRRWDRLRRYYDKYDASQDVEHSPRLSARMVAVLSRKPRAGRRRRS